MGHDTTLNFGSLVSIGNYPITTFWPLYWVGLGNSVYPGLFASKIMIVFDTQHIPD